MSHCTHSGLCSGAGTVQRDRKVLFALWLVHQLKRHETRKQLEENLSKNATQSHHLYDTMLDILVITYYYICDWSGVYTDAYYDVCAIMCPTVYSRINFLVSLFLLSSVLHLYGFNLGQHCEGRQGIDFCLRGLMGITLCLSSWGFAAGCDNTQNIPLNLSANLRPHQAKLRITWCLPL